MDFTTRIATELKIAERQAGAVIGLLGEGATVPFIARYRKEATGSLDEVAISAIRDRLQQLEKLENRRDAILSSLSERDILTPELKARIGSAGDLTSLEDIYLPFRPKRKTRASVARAKGLGPLADLLMRQETDPPADLEEISAPFVGGEDGPATIEEALEGARDIIAEMVSEDAKARESIRILFHDKGMISSRLVKGKEEEGATYRDYFEWAEPLRSAPSHRILAMMRGEREKVLRVQVAPPVEDAERILLAAFVRAETPASEQVALAVRDGYKRLLSLSIASETRVELKRRADEEAIAVFASNLRELLLAPPLGQKRVLAVDPGFRTGCKLAVMDELGSLLHHDAIYPHTGSGNAQRAEGTVREICEKYRIEAIAIGNGTAGRETETFFRGLGFSSSMIIVMVSESGASIYSASEVAREEFPDKDVTVRGAVSIGRRLMDPLAELVKIDPKSIGVGQYQHDVDQTQLRQSLDDVVMSCVNRVGVELNTASGQLLSYVSGLGPVLSANIVEYRNKNGPFDRRRGLLKVPRLGPKAFEQAAGFLRIAGAENILDSSAVHPESYHIVEAMASDLGCSMSDLIEDSAKRDSIKLEDYTDEKTGMPTLIDIMDELAQPGRDPRDVFEVFSFSDEVGSIEDVREGMTLPGIVTNVTAFGAFVDIGVHQDGLVHISQLADRFVRDPAEVVKVSQRVTVRVLEVDLDRRRISLSMKAAS